MNIERLKTIIAHFEAGRTGDPRKFLDSMPDYDPDQVINQNQLAELTGIGSSSIQKDRKRGLIKKTLRPEGTNKGTYYKLGDVLDWCIPRSKEMKEGNGKRKLSPMFDRLKPIRAELNQYFKKFLSNDEYLLAAQEIEESRNSEYNQLVLKMIKSVEGREEARNKLNYYVSKTTGTPKPIKSAFEHSREAVMNLEDVDLFHDRLTISQIKDFQTITRNLNFITGIMVNEPETILNFIGSETYYNLKENATSAELKQLRDFIKMIKLVSECSKQCATLKYDKVLTLIFENLSNKESGTYESL